jgi:hypothetical protein
MKLIINKAPKSMFGTKEDKSFHDNNLTTKGYIMQYFYSRIGFFHMRINHDSKLIFIYMLQIY